MLAYGVVLVALAGCSEGSASEPEPSDPAWTTESDCQDFAIQGDLVMDRRTGLQWDRTVWLTRMTYEEASAYCAAKAARLPSRPEVLALRTAEAQEGCLLSRCAFRGDRCATIQCGTQVPGVDARWGVAFSGGALVLVPDGTAEAVLCVR